MNNNILPSRPNIGRLKKEAKYLLKSVRTRDRSVVDLVQQSFKYRNLSAPDIFNSDFKLSDAQYILALKYGYKSWNELTTDINGKTREEFPMLKLKVKQPPLTSSFMSCLKGAADYFDLNYTVPMLFGLSGYAFLINVHKTICPSAVFVWGKDGFYDNLSMLGMSVEQTAEFEGDSNAVERGKMERKIKRHMSDGGLVIMESLENQLISGYDENGFEFVLPWGGRAGENVEFRRLTFGSWAECLESEFKHALFFLIKKQPPEKDFIINLKKALRYGLELYNEPEKHPPYNNDYSVGFGAYENWIKATNAGNETPQGNYYSSGVWSETRQMGSVFFAKTAKALDDPNAKGLCKQISGLYRQIGEYLGKAGRINFLDNMQRELSKNERISHLTAALELERQVAPKLAELEKMIMNEGKFIDEPERQKEAGLTYSDVMSPDEIKKQYQVEIKDMPELFVAYCQFNGSIDDNFDDYKNTFAKLINWADSKGLIRLPETKFLSYSPDNADQIENDKQRFYVGITVPENTPVDGEIKIMTFPEGKYAVAKFELAPTYDACAEAWKRIIYEWIPESDYIHDNNRPGYTVFLNDSKNHPEGLSIIEQYLPIRQI